MYKTKVWLYRSENEISKEGLSLSVDCDFPEAPYEKQIIKIDETNVHELEENDVWISFFGFGPYKVVKSENMFVPEIHDGFSYSVVAVKEF